MELLALALMVALPGGAGAGAGGGDGKLSGFGGGVEMKRRLLSLEAAASIG